MKKLLLASAVAALFATTAQAAPTVYGKAFVTVDYVDAEFDINEAKRDEINKANELANMNRPDDDQLPMITQVDANQDNLNLNSNGSRIGFKGAEAITEHTDVTYKLEYGVDIDGDDSKTFKRRSTFLGLKNDSFGEVRFGNMVAPLDYVNNVTVTKGYWDNLGSDNPEPTLSEGLTMTDAGRHSNTVMWLAPQMAGIPLEFTAMYKTEENNGDDGFGASLMFDQGSGFTAGIAYDNDLAIAGDVLRGSLTYDAANMTGFPIKLGALYQKADFDYSNTDEKGFVISAEMGLTNFSKPASVYVQYNNTSDLAGNNGLDSDQFVLGGQYMYKPNMIGHAYAGYNKTDNNRSEAEVMAIGGGLEYVF
ncbi:porin [Psychrobacter lutiphocae]|uniref:porin n=1 Tax=Psychrobacter lutiphocae TaxID=540500 RepID=UPI00035CC9BA|nr:porin [Psychrobacter lutiphocae]